MELRYMGFDQERNVRRYRFDCLSKGEPARRYVVAADMGMFLLHRVGLQEGPGLCARKLARDLEAQREGGHELTAADLLDYSKERKAAQARKEEARRHVFKRRRNPQGGGQQGV
jgi:hypothetical protein